MKLLLDTCVWGPTAESLRSAGYDVIWVGDSPEDPGDEEILATAYAEERILITLDKDFGELAVRHGTPHHGILRLVGFPARRQADASLAVLKAHGDDLFAGAIVTARRGQMKIRPPADPFVEVIETGATSTSTLQDDELVSENNWQRAAIEAIEALPTDVRENVGYSPPTTRMVIVNVSVEPFGEEETHMAKIEVTWWDSVRDRGWPREFDTIYGTGGIHEEQADWPVITVRGESTAFEQGLYPGRATIGSLKREVQVLVLEEMWGGGGISMMGKDSKGRFIRDDGSPILSWQFSKRKRRRKRRGRSDD